VSENNDCVILCNAGKEENGEIGWDDKDRVLGVVIEAFN
jgi:hypothetical protein